MIDEKLVWPYWSVDLPRLSEHSARSSLAWAESARVSLGGIAVDPASACSVHLDDVTVESLRQALQVALRSKSLPLEQSEIVRGLHDQLTSFLSGRPRTADSG